MDPSRRPARPARARRSRTWTVCAWAVLAPPAVASVTIGCSVPDYAIDPALDDAGTEPLDDTRSGDGIAPTDTGDARKDVGDAGDAADANDSDGGADADARPDSGRDGGDTGPLVDSTPDTITGLDTGPGVDTGGTCSPPSLLCGGPCVDVTTDPANCGSCGAACPTGAACVASRCTCPASAPDTCGTPPGCVDKQSDPKNCGVCGIQCDVPGGERCTGGRCM